MQFVHIFVNVVIIWSMGTFVWFIIIFLDICSDVLAFVFDGIRVKISSDLFGSDFGIIKLKKWLNSKFRK